MGKGDQPSWVPTMSDFTPRSSRRIAAHLVPVALLYAPEKRIQSSRARGERRPNSGFVNAGIRPGGVAGERAIDVGDSHRNVIKPERGTIRAREIRNHHARILFSLPDPEILPGSRAIRCRYPPTSSRRQVHGA
jgi:hypothetical protein